MTQQQQRYWYSAGSPKGYAIERSGLEQAVWIHAPDPIGCPYLNLHVTDFNPVRMHALKLEQKIP